MDLLWGSFYKIIMFILVISMEKLEIVFPTRDLKVRGPQTLPLTYPRFFKHLLCAYVRLCKQDKALEALIWLPRRLWMGEWMEGWFSQTTFSFKKKMRGFFVVVCFYCMNFLHSGWISDLSWHLCSVLPPVTRNIAMCNAALYTSFTGPKPLKLLRLL